MEKTNFGPCLYFLQKPYLVRVTKPSAWSTLKWMKEYLEQAGAELCQAQYKLELAMFWFGSVASSKFDCLVQTGVAAN